MNDRTPINRLIEYNSEHRQHTQYSNTIVVLDMEVSYREYSPSKNCKTQCTSITTHPVFRYNPNSKLLSVIFYE